MNPCAVFPIRAAVVVSVAFLSASPAIHARDRIPDGMFFGMTSPGKKGTDDEGAPREILDRVYRQSQANLYSAACNWGDCEPDAPVSPDAPADGEAPRAFDWSTFDPALRAIPGGCAAIVKLRLGNRWAEPLRESDPERYWTLAEGFLAAAAERAREIAGDRARFFQAPGNEPSLTMRPDWAERHVEPIRHYYRAIKSASAENLLIAGALVVGDRPRVEALYRAGIKDHFDVLDIHAYGDERTHVDIDQVIETHRVMAEHGDADKQIFLGEGWACFPLPDAVEKMNTDGPRPYTPDEAEHYWQALVRGYYQLTTPRDGYDPAWVLGARYFTMNDFWGSRHWKNRAEPVYGDDGKIDHYTLDGYYVPNEPGVLEPKYRPWGLVDLEGRPKGPQLIEEFPPRIPSVELTARLPGRGWDGTILAGRPYKVFVEVVNREPGAITGLRPALGVDNRKQRGRFRFEMIDPPHSDRVAAGAKATAVMQLRADPALAGAGPVRALAEIEYRYDGLNYYADAWIDLAVRAVATMSRIGDGSLAPTTDAAARFRLRLSTVNRLPVTVPVRIEAPAGIAIAPPETTVVIAAGRDAEVVFAAQLADAGSPGSYTLRAVSEPGVEPVTIPVAFPRRGWRAPPQIAGVLRNGGFEEIGPGTGFYAWQGDPPNWEAGDAGESLEAAGDRWLSYASDGMKFDRGLTQRVPIDPEHAGRSAVGAVWFRGDAHSGAEHPDAVQCRLRLRALDPHGHELAKGESPWRAADGAWGRVEQAIGPVPDGTVAIEYEIRVRNEEGPGWHHAWIDRASLDWGSESAH